MLSLILGKLKLEASPLKAVPYPIWLAVKASIIPLRIGIPQTKMESKLRGQLQRILMAPFSSNSHLQSTTLNITPTLNFLPWGSPGKIRQKGDFFSCYAILRHLLTCDFFMILEENQKKMRHVRMNTTVFQGKTRHFLSASM